MIITGSEQWIVGGLNLFWGLLSAYFGLRLWRVNRADRQVSRYQWGWMLVWLGAAALARATYTLGGGHLAPATGYWLRVTELYLWGLAILDTLLAAFFMAIPAGQRDRLMWLPWLQFFVFLLAVSFLRHDFYLVSMNYAPVLLLLGWFLLQDARKDRPGAFLWYGIVAFFLLFLLDEAMGRSLIGTHVALPAMAIVGALGSYFFFRGGVNLQDREIVHVQPPFLKRGKQKRKPGDKRRNRDDQ